MIGDNRTVSSERGRRDVVCENTLVSFKLLVALVNSASAACRQRRHPCRRDCVHVRFAAPGEGLHALGTPDSIWRTQFFFFAIRFSTAFLFASQLAQLFFDMKILPRWVCRYSGSVGASSGSNLLFGLKMPLVVWCSLPGRLRWR